MLTASTISKFPVVSDGKAKNALAALT